MRKARAIEKLNIQLRPLPLPKVPKTVNKRQRLLAVLEICSCSSEVTNPGFYLHVAAWKEALPLSRGSQADRSSHVTKSRAVESDNNQDLPPSQPGPWGLPAGSRSHAVE